MPDPATISSIMEAFYCRNSAMEAPDEGVAFGRYLCGLDPYIRDLGTLKAFASDAALLKKNPAFPHPKEAPLGELDEPFLNDLYTPACRKDVDGVFRIYFPGYGARLSRGSLERDWRYLLLATTCDHPELFFDEGQLVILEVWYADGARVQAAIEPSTWEVLQKMVLWAMSPSGDNPGEHCWRCAKRTTCKTFAGFVSYYGEDAIKVKDKTQYAMRLYAELVQVRARLKVDEDKRKEITQKLLSCAEEGRINIGGLMTLEVPPGERVSYDFSQVYDYLRGLNFWKPEFAKIQITELHKAKAMLPPKVQEKLDMFKKVEPTEPSIREVVHHAPNSIETPLLRGISFKK